MTDKNFAAPPDMTIEQARERLASWSITDKLFVHPDARFDRAIDTLLAATDPAKLVVPKGWIEKLNEINNQCRHLRQCKQAPMDLEDLSFALDRAVELANEMLDEAQRFAAPQPPDAGEKV